MTERPQPLRHILIRVLEGLNETAGYLAPEALRRDITFRVNHGGTNPDNHTMPGLVIIGTDQAEPIARAISRITLKIMRTPELLWLPVNAHREFGAWTIECVPLTDWIRLTSLTDDSILRASNIDPTTGQPARQGPR